MGRRSKVRCGETLRMEGSVDKLYRRNLFEGEGLAR